MAIRSSSGARPKSVPGNHYNQVVNDNHKVPRAQTSFRCHGDYNAPELDFQLCSSDPCVKHNDFHIQSDIRSDPEPLKLVKKYGYGYRKPDRQVIPHWIQWPQPRPADRRIQTAQDSHSLHNPSDSNPAQICNAPGADNARHLPSNHGVATMNDQQYLAVMNRGLSPRRTSFPRMPGRTLSHYGSFGNREEPNPYAGNLDMYASPFNANRGFNQGITSYSTRDTRPMHRHLRRARHDEGYLHNYSIFYSTTPMQTGYFVIHPDWVSERLTLRRSQSLLSF